MKPNIERLFRNLDTLGKRIKAARTYNNLTQTQLAENLGTALRQVQRWEADDHEPAASWIPKLADALGVTVSFLHADSRTWNLIKQTGFNPEYVLKRNMRAPETPEEALALFERDTDYFNNARAEAEELDIEIDELEDIKGLFNSGELEWFDNALVMWEDAIGQDDRCVLEFLMFV